MIGRVFGFATLLFGWALVAGAGAAVWLHFYESKGKFALWLTSAVPFAVFAVIVALAIGLVARRWFLTAGALIVGVALVYTQGPLWVAQTPPSGEPVTVMSSNLELGGGDIDELAGLVAAEQPDILSIQEVTPEALARIRASTIATDLPHEFAVPGNSASGTAILSKTPLTDQSTVDNTMFENLHARTDVRGAPGTAVVAVHPAAPVPETWHWLRDMDILQRYLHALPDGPVIAVGDYNATWDQVRLRHMLTDGYGDAAEQAGAGFLPTYPTDRLGGNRPVIGIDHVIARGFVASDVKSVYLSGTDHRVLVVSLVAS